MKEILTIEKFATIHKMRKDIAESWYPHIITACERFEINTELRIAMFLAQVGHESSDFSRLTENLNYSASGLLSTFGKYFDSKSAKEYERKPEKIANRVYANRMGNGNEGSGDGWKYRGHGLIQLTGKENFTNAERALGFSLVSDPRLATTHENASLIAAWFFHKTNINSYSDRKDIKGATRVINGGYNGLSDRENRYYNAITILMDGEGDAYDFANSVDPDTTTSRGNNPTPPPHQSYIKEPTSTGYGDYPHVHSNITTGGHKFIVDNTSGNEIIETIHASGSYDKINPDGTKIEKSFKDKFILVLGNFFNRVGGDYTLETIGQTFMKMSQFVITSSSNIFIRAESQIQLNTPEVMFSERLSGKQSDIETGHFVDLMVDNTIQANCETANYISYEGASGMFNMRTFADSVNTYPSSGLSRSSDSSNVRVEFTDNTGFTKPITLGASQMTIIEKSTGGENETKVYTPVFANAEGKWINMLTGQPYI